MSDSRIAEDLADLFENAPCGYLSLSPGGRILMANRTLAEWLGTASDALVGRSLHDLLSFGGRIAYETHLAPMLRLQGRVDELALDLIDAAGSKIPVIANSSEKRDTDGRHLFTRITLFRAIERRSYERSLIAARTEAEAAVNAEHETAVLREQFIAVLGHDLRNPLAALDAGVRMLSGRSTLSERDRHILSEMGASVGRAGALIEDVLDLARGRLGPGLTLNRNAARPLTPVLEQVVAEICAARPDREIRTHFAIEEPIDCDQGRIAQLASNLVANAVAHGEPDRPIEVEASCVEGKLLISVVNAGRPIPDEARAQLFQPFFRGAVRQSQQGLGLGLFIVSEIAKAHGGEMEVASSAEQTRFTFSMPLAAPHRPGLGSPEANM